MKIKILFIALAILFFANKASAVTWPDPPVTMPPYSTVIEWQGYDGRIWIVYKMELAYRVDKGNVLGMYQGAGDYWLHPMNWEGLMYLWNGSSWVQQMGQSYWNVRLGQGDNWRDNIRSNSDLYYYQNDYLSSFNWNGRYGGIGVANAGDYSQIGTKLLTANWDFGLPPKFKITSPVDGDYVRYDTWATVEGTCPINGPNRVGFTGDCVGYDKITYDTDCVDNKFSGQFFRSSASNKIIAREISSQSGDCVDYDNLVDWIEVKNLEVINGYPSEWYFDFNYYNDYNITINSPVFDLPALTLPNNSTSKIFSFKFTYPTDKLNSLRFNIKQYDKDGQLLNENYHSRDLAEMTDTNNYEVELMATSTSYHYVVQLTENGEMKRQYPFAIFTSDLTAVVGSDDVAHLFPRLVEVLKQKVIFNYFFAFYDGFYNLFRTEAITAEADALDIKFKSVSDNGKYALDIKIFSASNELVKRFSNGLRPYVISLLWLSFAAYVIFRITHLFNDNE